MQAVAFARRIARTVRRIALPEAAAIASYRHRRYQNARVEFARALRRGESRRTLLYAASVEDKLKDAARRDIYLARAAKKFPPVGYDFASALTATTARPLERDDIAQFAVANAQQLTQIATQRAASARSEPRYAFVYWDSEQQPDIVQHCIASMREHLPADLTLVELNAQTIGEWITIDPRIMARVDIPAHAADMIRLHLLSTYGGMWIDASCLLNPSFPDYVAKIREEDFFLFTYAGARTGNWFIWARPGSYRLQLLRAALDTWFLSGRSWSNYFHFHDTVEMLYWTDAQYRADWDRALRIHPGTLFDCHKALGHPVTDDEWAQVRHAHPINKLSWRKYNAPELRADPTTGVSRFIAEPIEPLSRVS
jgi:hypothetical protein